MNKALAALVGALGLAAALGGAVFGGRAAAEGREIPAPAVKVAAPSTASETAVFAGGCFWGVQAVFQHVKGVTAAVSGYAGDDRATAIYEVVSSGRTGHAEAVQISFDPRRISYAKLLQIYFSVAHDPTELDRQGPDVGPQYRSAVFPQNDEQARVARDYIDQLAAARAFPDKIVTTIEPGRAFFPAEAYHQDFLTRHPTHPYIVYNDMPKLAALERLFPDEWRAAPALVSAAAR